MANPQLFTPPLPPEDAPNHVRPDEGRCDVCGNMAHNCTGAPEHVLERIRRFIKVYASLEGWTFAKTMPDIPHSYAVRARAARMRLVNDDGEHFTEATGEDEFVWIAQAIRAYGYKRSWKPGAKALHYVNVDGWRYWTMGNPIDPTPGSNKTTILNRAPLTREGREQLRRENGLTNTRWYECEQGHRFGVVIEAMNAFVDGTAGVVPPDPLQLGITCPMCADDRPIWEVE